MNIFLSSAVEGLGDARLSLIERLSARSDGRLSIVCYETHRHLYPTLTPEETCLRLVRDCEALIVLIDQYYGMEFTRDPTISITHAEVREARGLGLAVIPVVRTRTWHEFFVWRNNRDLKIRFAHVKEPQLFTLLEELYPQYNCHHYDNLTAEEALRQIAESLDAILSQGSSGVLGHVTLTQ